MRRRAPSGRPPWLEAAALGLTLGGCSVVLGFDDECTDDADCAGRGEALVCAEKLCVTRESAGGAATLVDRAAGCHTLYGVPAALAQDPGTILLGSLLSSSGDLAAFGPPIERAIQLAVDEINQVGGIDGRKLAVLACDDGTDAAKAVPAARHLVENARVAAIVGANPSGVTIEAFNQVARPGGVLMMSPSATSPALTDLADDGLLWRTAPSDSIQGRAVAAYMRAAGYQKVAVVNRDDAYGTGLQEAIRESFCQGRACTDAEYRVHTYADESLTTDLTNAVVDLVAFAPDVTVLISYLDDGVAFLNVAAARGLHNFILTDGAKADTLAEAIEDPRVLSEIFGTAPASPEGDACQTYPVYCAFSARYRTKWNAEPGIFAANAYDATYLLALAIAAEGPGGPVSGDRIARQLKRLSTGDSVRAGASDFNRGVSTLRSRANANVDFLGASGPLDFDPRTGEAPGDIAGWRIDLETKKVATTAVIYTAAGQFIEPLSSDAPDAGVGSDGGAQ